MSSSHPDQSPEAVFRDDIVTFDVDSIREQIVCKLCDGLFREPYTIARCLHSFCKSCLLVATSADYYQCPTCGLYLGKDLFKFAIPDRKMQDLIDKTLFPQVAKMDEEMEAEFYHARGIKRKSGVLLKDESNSPQKLKKQAQDIVFHLQPEQHSTLSRLNLPFLKTQGTIRIDQIKKLLHLRLKYDHDDPTDDLQILCNGVPLGNELSVAFVARTVWMEAGQYLLLHYRRRKDAEDYAKQTTYYAPDV